ncbi:hypothetical protein REPUB_Repub08aG0074400 [Reevesia pubescens]
MGRFQKTLGNFTSLNYWVVRDYYCIVNSVNAFEPEIQRLSDEQLTAKTSEFKKRLSQGDTLSDIQAEQVAFMTREYHIYMTSDGRISMAGLSSKTIPHLADAIHAAVTRMS